MAAVAVRVQKISKRYRIGKRPFDGGGSLKRALRFMSSPLSRFRELSGAIDDSESFWALNDVSFDVSPGEVIGIVGRNGAGKSTLLKILSQISEPTSGRIEINGRVASLLEVGTGFHTELSGRENVFLNGAILGMSRAEMRRKFDEIVDFSGVEKFLDTPVKRYSSGMMVRLAFAVAAHLDPEILIVDEVLAVGDQAFQAKCMGKMNEVAKSGRTILFVSHNMTAVRAICTRGILLNSGCVELDSPIESLMRHYSDSLVEAASQPVADRTDRGGDGTIRFANVTIVGERGGAIQTGSPLEIIFEVNSLLSGLVCVFTIYDNCGTGLFSGSSNPASICDVVDPSLVNKFCCRFDEAPFLSGSYRVNAALYRNGDLCDHLEGAATFQVSEGNMRHRPPVTSARWGCFTAPHVWSKGS